MDDRHDDFDRWLSTLIKSVQTQAGSKGAVVCPDVGSRPAATRIFGPFLATIVVVATVWLALMAHEPAARQSVPSGGAASFVPWRALPAESVPPFTRPGVAPCRASGLTITATGSPYVGGGPVNTSFWNVTVRNRGPVVCFIGATLDVTFLTGSGAPHLRRSDLIRSEDVVYLRPPGVPGSSSEAIGEIDAGCLPSGTRLEISPGPTLGSLTIDPGPRGGSAPFCAHPIGAYSALLYPCCDSVPSTPPSAPAAIHAPEVVHPGDHVRFLVTVTDVFPVGHRLGGGPPPPTAPPISLEPCPTYLEELEGASGSAAAYGINCSHAKPIASGGAETFEMFIDVPPNAHPGPSVLTWRLISPNNSARGASIVEIAP